MKAKHSDSLFFLLMLLLAVGVYPWCQIGRLNLTATINKVDFSHDGLLIAATSISANKV